MGSGLVFNAGIQCMRCMLRRTVASQPGLWGVGSGYKGCRIRG
jgi:hypothetical protein